MFFQEQEEIVHITHLPMSDQGTLHQGIFVLSAYLVQPLAQSVNCWNKGCWCVL